MFQPAGARVVQAFCLLTSANSPRTNSGHDFVRSLTFLGVWKDGRGHRNAERTSEKRVASRRRLPFGRFVSRDTPSVRSLKLLRRQSRRYPIDAANSFGIGVSAAVGVRALKPPSLSHSALLYSQDRVVTGHTSGEITYSHGEERPVVTRRCR